MREEILRLEHVTYEEQGVTQLENFSISIRMGEIMGLVPANRYGLSALIKLLQQNLPLHYGYIYFREKMINQWKNSDFSWNRISVIQNKSCLIEGFTVTENVFVLRQGFKKRFIRTKVLKQQLLRFFEEIDVEIDADAYIENLSAFERLVVELVKAVVAGHYLVVLEDLSSFISVVEIKKLHKIIKYYAENGMSFLYVDTHLEEAKQICDRTAIMRNGQIVKIFDTDDLIPRSSLYQWSEGFDKHVSEQIEKKSVEAENREIVFSANGLYYKDVKDLTFSVRAGECLVLQDLNNHILSGLPEILSCEQKLEQGEIWIGGEKLSPKLRRNLAVIQEIPVQTMLFPEMSYLDNLCFTLDHRCPDVWRKSAFKRSLQMEYSELLGEDVFDLPVEALTQKQKYDLVYTRILLQKPKVVFCIQPFKRAELSLRVHVWELLERFLNNGISVVIVAVNLADSLALADRLIRIGKNNQVKEYSKEEFRDLPVDAPWLYLYQERDSEER